MLPPSATIGPWTIAQTKPILRKDFNMMLMPSFTSPKAEVLVKLGLLRACRDACRRLADLRFGLGRFAKVLPRLAASEQAKPLLAPGG